MQLPPRCRSKSLGFLGSASWQNLWDFSAIILIGNHHIKLLASRIPTFHITNIDGLFKKWQGRLGRFPVRNLNLAEGLLLPSVLKGFSHSASSLSDALILRQYYFSNIDYLYLYLSLIINKILNIDIEMLTPFVHLDFSWAQFGIENGSITYEPSNSTAIFHDLNCLN